MTPTASEKSQIYQIWRQKSQSGNPAEQCRCQRYDSTRLVCFHVDTARLTVNSTMLV